jgi:cysteinyl-tRNA synthetase
MAGWAPASAPASDAALALDARFRTAIADDLDLPTAVVVVNELVSSAEVADGEKYALLASWDHVLGLDVEREATSGWTPGDDVLALVAERDAARAAKDYATSDRIRDQLAAMGLEVMDGADGTSVRPAG